HGVALIYDEVQSGFGLGGGFAWHRSFGLVDADGNPDGPECVTFAKRAQVGVCMSVYEDPEPTAAHPASLVRGRLHVGMVSGGQAACKMQGMLWPRLQQLAAAYPQLVQNPRCRGFAMAFDMPMTALLNAYLGQRWWRGAVVFAAGDRTVRCRLSTGLRRREVEMLFETMRRSLSWLDAHPGQNPPVWENLGSAWSPNVHDDEDYRVRHASAAEADVLVPAICALEARVYEPARQDPPEKHRIAFDDPDGIVIVAETRGPDGWTLVGKALGVPLEHVP